MDLATCRAEFAALRARVAAAGVSRTRWEDLLNSIFMGITNDCEAFADFSGTREELALEHGLFYVKAARRTADILTGANR